MPESNKHLALKQLLETKMKEWFGASISEYSSSGHELDVFAVTSSGVSVYIEVIWSHSRTQFLTDINMLQQSDAQVKVVVSSPEILADNDMNREFGKVVVAQRRQNKVVHGDMLNGQRILEDPEYVGTDLRELLNGLVTQARRASGATIRLVDTKIVKSDWAKGEFYNVIVRVVCEGNRIVGRLRASIVFGEPPPDYCHVDDSGKVTISDLKSVTHSWSPDGTDKHNRMGEWPEMRQGDSVFLVFPDAPGTGFGLGNRLQWWKDFFCFRHGSRYVIMVRVQGISGNETVLAEEKLEFTP